MGKQQRMAFKSTPARETMSKRTSTVVFLFLILNTFSIMSPSQSGTRVGAIFVLCPWPSSCPSPSSSPSSPPPP
jgi:hypothetical protein